MVSVSWVLSWCLDSYCVLSNYNSYLLKAGIIQTIWTLFVDILSRTIHIRTWPPFLYLSRIQITLNLNFVPIPRDDFPVIVRMTFWVKITQLLSNRMLWSCLLWGIRCNLPLWINLIQINLFPIIPIPYRTIPPRQQTRWVWVIQLQQPRVLSWIQAFFNRWTVYIRIWRRIVRIWPKTIPNRNLLRSGFHRWIRMFYWNCLNLIWINRQLPRPPVYQVRINTPRSRIPVWNWMRMWCSRPVWNSISRLCHTS